MTNPPTTTRPDPSRWRLRLLAALLLPIPTIAVLCLQGPTAILRMNALTYHDGMAYYEVSLSPLGEPEYCSDPVRYTRVLFPAVVHATASVVAAVVRAGGGGGWLQETFGYDGVTVANYAVLHAVVYRACLLAAAWVATVILGNYLRNNAVAVLINAVLLQLALFKGLLTPIDIALVVLCVRAADAWVGSNRPSWRAGAAL